MNNLKELRLYIYRLYITFLKNHVNAQTLLPSADEEDGVKAFCVLAHAALEEYFEKITIRTLEGAYKKHQRKEYITAIPVNQEAVDELNELIFQLVKTLVLSSTYSIYSKNGSDTLKKHKSKLESVTEMSRGTVLTPADMSNLMVNTNTYSKDILKETRTFFSSYVNENHGASLKYILKLLIPVGVDVPQTLQLNSLQRLAEYRGNFAHSSGLNQIISASDAVKYMVDTVKLCTAVENSIKDFHSYVA